MTKPNAADACNGTPRGPRRLICLLVFLAAAAGLVAPSAANASPQLTKGEGTGAGWCTSYGTGGAKGLYSYDNVWACGPDQTKGATPFDENGTASFQCVELSERFLWAVDGLSPIFGNDVDGKNLVSLYHNAHPSIGVGQPSPNSTPAPGDVISFGPGGWIDSVGHTAVVVSATNSSGNFTIMSENWANTAGEETVHIDRSGDHNGEIQFSGSADWNAASWLKVGTPSGAAQTFAFQASTGSLWTATSAAGKNLALGLMKGTSPAIVSMPSGGYEIAFQANTGVLWAVGPAGNVNTKLAMAAGTSPAIAASSAGGYKVAYQNSAHQLEFYASAGGAQTTTQGMKSATSPAITALSNGAYQAAFQANTGALIVWGSLGNRNTKLAMAAGTSPAMAASSAGGYKVAYQNSTHQLEFYASAGGAQTTTQGMKSATSPAITALSNGAYQAAFQANTGALIVWGSLGNRNTGLGMAAGTSPAIAASPAGGYTAGFQANTGSLFSYSSSGGATNLHLGMMAKTSPSLTST